MKIARCINLAIVLTLLAACNGNGNGPGSTALPTPVVSTTRVPNTDAAMRAYLDAFVVEDFTSMYTLLTQASRADMAVELFSSRYQSALSAMNVSQIEYSILSTLTNPQTAQVAFRVVYHTVLFGDIQREIVAALRLEGGQWRLDWHDGLILPELAGENVLRTDYRIPARGDIYDRSGNAIATQADAYAIGLVPGQIIPDQEENLLTELFRLTGLRPDTIRELYVSAQPDWYIPVAEVSAEVLGPRYNILISYGGVVLVPYTSRYYYNNGVAPQTVGYTRFIDEAETEFYRRRGYSGGERVGDQGIEKWGEEYLAGRNSATLYVVAPDGSIVSQLYNVDAQPAASITMTIDRDLQYQAQQAMNGMAGAAVVIEVETGRVLAMVSTPGYDPNLFDPDNYNNIDLINMLNRGGQPLYNRSSQGTYPLGSVFKIITMAAALESGLYTADTTYDCQYEFTELLDRTLYDWTYERNQRGIETPPSGVLTLPQGLMRSCNPWFWHIGLDLYNQGHANDISEMARGFGLGQATGIGQVAESSGNISNPGDGIQAINIAIGQGDVLVSPLQVAVFTAALANGGTLYQPQLVENVQPVSGDPLLTFQPVTSGTLPITAENLAIIQNAMRLVTSNSRGTAYHRLGTLSIPVAGKTGTAESGIPGFPHSWFTGYTLANRSDRPDIAVVVFVENMGEGSDYAAPIFRRIVEIYFYGRPQSIYWFESAIGVTETPTPQGGE